MILNNILIISIGKFSLLWLIMYLLIIFIDHIRQKRMKYSKEEIKKSPILTKMYLDQFYITNKLYTFCITYMYIFGIVIVFILLRYASLDNIINFLPQENLYTALLQVIFIYIIVFVTIILYRSLLAILFKKEVNKFYIYLLQFHWFARLEQMMEFKLGDYIFGCLYLLTYRIATLTYKENMYPLGMSDVEYLFNGEYEYFIENKRIAIYIYIVMDLVRKYILIKKLLRTLAYIFGFAFKHISKTYKLLPYFILISIFIIDLYNKEFNHIYLASFIFLFIKTKHDYVTFKNKRSYSYDIDLSNYFYKNKKDYNNQRIYLYSNNNITMEHIQDSLENKLLLLSINKIIEYAFNNFEDSVSKEYKESLRKETGIYRRFWILIGFITLGYMLLINTYLQTDIPIILLLLPIIVMLYSHCKTYYELVPEEEISGSEEYKYSRKHNIIFWIAAIIQGYIYWILILKPHITLMETETLIELFKITKIYTIDEKVIYLYQYFEYYVSLTDIDRDYLRYIMRQIDYKELLSNKVLLKDIQVYIKLLIDNYYLIETFYEIVQKNMVETYVSNNQWYIFLQNILLIGVITSSLIYYKNILIIVNQLYTPGGIYLIVKDFYKIFI